MPPPNAPDTPSYWNPYTGGWEPLVQNAEGVYSNPLLAGGQNPYATQAGALYGEEAAAGQRLSAQNILSQIRSRDATANASMQSAQQAMKAANLQADELKERMRQFDITTTEGRRQFDLSLGFDREKFGQQMELQRQQLQLQGAEAILGAPRGPADFFAYASRLPSVANAGGSALGNIFGQALQNISGESLTSLQQGDVLSNSQLATDLVRASQGGAVSDATSTFLRRSLGVNVPGATQVAQQQAQQAAASGGVQPAAGVPGMAPWAVVPFEQFLAQNGYDTPYMGGYEGGGDYSDPTQVAGYRRSAAQGEAAAAFAADQPRMSAGDIAKGFSSFTPINYGKTMRELQGDYAAYVQGTMANEQLRQQQAGGAGQYLAPGAGFSGGAGGNAFYNALLAGGPSFMQRLGALGGQIPRGYGTSIQEWNRFEPTAQAMYTGLLSEAGLETPEDFLAGVVKAAPNFAPSRMTRMR